jgi:predicted AAA+ superfamily ATPase
LVFQQLKLFGYNVTVGQLKDKEIDFVCDKGEERLYVQVAYLIADKKTKEREFGNLLKIDDNYPKIVVSLDEAAGGQHQGVKHINIREFLTSAL